MKEEKFCEICGNPLTGKKLKYCSKKCMKKSQKIKRETVNPISPTPVSEFEQTQINELKQLREDNAMKREIKASSLLDRDLQKQTAGEDPLDRLIRIKQFNAMNSGDNQNQNQNVLFQIQADNFKAQLEMQKELGKIASDVQKQQFDFMKLELERVKKEGSPLGELAKFRELAKEMDYEKKGEDSFSKVATLVSQNAKFLPEVINAIKGKGGEEALRAAGLIPPEATQTLPVPEQNIDTSGGEFPSQEGAVSFIAPPQEVLQPKQMSDAEIEKYAKQHYINQGEGDDANDIISQSLGLGKYSNARKKYK